eukprot:2625862-Prymnesium_polylepis.1
MSFGTPGKRGSARSGCMAYATGWSADPSNVPLHLCSQLSKNTERSRRQLGSRRYGCGVYARP